MWCDQEITTIFVAEYNKLLKLNNSKKTISILDLISNDSFIIIRINNNRYLYSTNNIDSNTLCQCKSRELTGKNEINQSE